MGVVRRPFRRPGGALTATLQMTNQAFPCKPIDVAERHTRIAVAKRKTQEVDTCRRLVQVHHASFLAIDRQFKTAFKWILHPVDELFALVTGQDDESSGNEVV